MFTRVHKVPIGQSLFDSINEMGLLKMVWLLIGKKM